MAFTPIETQEELDQLIQQRLERERKVIETKYADYDKLKNEIEDLQKKLVDATHTKADTEKQIADLQDKVRGYEVENLKTQIAQETGIPFALRGRLQGSTEEEIRKDAEALVGLIGANSTKPTAAAPAPKLNENAGTGDPLMGMVKNLKFGG